MPVTLRTATKVLRNVTKLDNRNFEFPGCPLSYIEQAGLEPLSDYGNASGQADKNPLKSSRTSFRNRLNNISTQIEEKTISASLEPKSQPKSRNHYTLNRNIKKRNILERVSPFPWNEIMKNVIISITWIDISIPSTKIPTEIAISSPKNHI